MSEPPENLIAEDVQQWPVGEEYVTYLYNPDGQASNHQFNKLLFFSKHIF